MSQHHSYSIRLLLAGFLALSLAFPSLAVAQTDSHFSPVANSPSEDALTPMSAEEAATKLRVPSGFQTTLFASEPDVQNPIAMAWDEKNRLWIAENYTYSDSKQRFELQYRDRVIVFEDRDRDGKADNRRVFCDNVQMLTSVEVGRGGVWLMCPPQLLFVPDADGDARPDGPARVVLDGFDVAQDNYHNFANGLKFGPDGWLYGRCGHSCPGKIGLPGTPKEQRVPLDGGIWRFHPDHKIAEALCHGTTNPWGHDWDRNGELFFINTVIGHLWHMIPGCHFKESFGESQNPRVYERMDMIADHYHFDRNGTWMDSRDGKANDLGGGHAHIGAIIYLGTQWPRKYHDRLFTINMHGRRTNVERLELTETGYVGKHEPDVFLAEDPFFRGLDLSIGPDGCCYIIDWSDTGECHEHNGVHRRSGRIYRISYGDASPPSSFAKPWCTAGTGPLQTLWSNYRASSVTKQDLHQLMDHSDPHMRVWAIRLLTDLWPLDHVTGPHPQAKYVNDASDLSVLTRRALKENSALVRMQLASTLQRLSLKDRLALAWALAATGNGGEDVNLNMLVWFGLSPIGESDPVALAQFGRQCFWPGVNASIARFLASRHGKGDSTALSELIQLPSKKGPELQAEVLSGITEGMQGRHKAIKPAGWDQFVEAVPKTNENQEKIRHLSAVFGDGVALEEIRKIALDGKAANRDRQLALQTLIDAKVADLRSLCESLMDTRVVNATAAKGLATFDDPAIARMMVQKYRRFQPEDRPLIVELLASRTSFAEVMLDELAKGKSPLTRDDIKATHARQIRDLGVDDLTEKLTKVWGSLNQTAADKTAKIESLKSMLTPEVIAKADSKHGRQLFDKTCAQCHKLFGAGKQIGPDITGAQRSSLDYLLGNIVDPSAVVGKEYCMTTLLTKDGRAISGLVTSADAQRTLIQTATELLTVPADEIESSKPSTISAMPEGLLQNLSDSDISALIAYLMSPVQIENNLN